MKKILVFTTINIPNIIEDYVKNFSDYGHAPEEAEIIIIGDLKSPAGTKEYISKIDKSGFRIDYFDVKEQEEWMEKYPNFKKIIPYNSDNRRNIGYLMAAERGADIIIAVDDDNYPNSSVDFLTEHGIVGSIADFDAVTDESRWFNICSLIKFNSERKVYPRGYPYYARFKDGKATVKKLSGRIVMNEGLWLEDPDIDSITRLTENVKGMLVEEKSVILGKRTFSPINSQNTAFHRDILPCSYFVIMGGKIDGLVIERYGDIWFGFFAKRIIDHMGDYVRFGSPVAIHRRNSHNLLKDLKQEFWAITFTEDLAKFMEEVQLSAKTYSATYIELAEKLDLFVKDKKYGEDAEKYFKNVTDFMKIWAETCQIILEDKR